MEKTYFTSLNTTSRTELIWNYGEIVKAIETDKIYIILFLLDNFFVEIYVNKATNELQNVVVQDDSDVLYEYIKDLNIDKLIKVN